MQLTVPDRDGIIFPTNRKNDILIRNFDADNP